MAYVTIDKIQNVLSVDFAAYANSVDTEIGWAESEIDSLLGGHYSTPFDDTSLYSAVPPTIEWIAALLTGWKIWDAKTVLEGVEDDTAAGRWKEMAYKAIAELKSGERTLINVDGTTVSKTTSGPRFYPSGVKEKADSADNLPYFKRAQAGEW